MASFTRYVQSNELDTTYIRRELINALEVALVAADFATPGEVPNNVGSTLRWILDANLSTATATDALDEVGPGYDMSYAERDTLNEDTYAPTTVEGQLHTYGVFVPVRLTDLDNMPRGLMDRLSARCSYRGRLLLDDLLLRTVDGQGTGYGPSMGAGTTTTRIGVGGTADSTLDATDQLTAEDIALATGDLWANDAVPFSNGMYAAIVHSVAATHLITDVSTTRLAWEQINKYVSGVSGQQKLTTGEIGGITGTMVFRSNDITQETIDTLSAYDNIVTAQDGYGNAKMETMDPKVFINKPDASSTDNPYRMYGTVSFTLRAAPTLLDVLRVLKLSTAP